MGERKVSKPRVVRMWAVWYDDLKSPSHVDWHGPSARSHAHIVGARVVRVEVREVPKKKRKAKRG